MNDLRTAAQQALEAMSSFESGTGGLYEGEFSAEIAALRAALAEQTVPSDCTDSHQPVAWYHVPHPGNGISPVVSMFQQREPSLYGAVVPLYTAPPQRKPLTDKEIDALRQGAERLNFVTLREFRIIACAIERAHGIGDSDD